MKCLSKNDKNGVAKNSPLTFKSSLAKLKKGEKLAVRRSKDNKNEVAKKPPFKTVKLLLGKQKKGGSKLSKFSSMKNGEKICKEGPPKNIKNEVAEKQKVGRTKGMPLTEKQKAKKFTKKYIVSRTATPNVVRKDLVANAHLYSPHGIIVRKKASQVNINNNVATDMKTHELMK